jgi:hypothetical protein
VLPLIGESRSRKSSEWTASSARLARNSASPARTEMSLAPSEKTVWSDEAEGIGGVGGGDDGGDEGGESETAVSVTEAEAATASSDAFGLPLQSSKQVSARQTTAEAAPVKTDFFSRSASSFRKRTVDSRWSSKMAWIPSSPCSNQRRVCRRMGTVSRAVGSRRAAGQRTFWSAKQTDDHSSEYLACSTASRMKVDGGRSRRIRHGRSSTTHGGSSSSQQKSLDRSVVTTSAGRRKKSARPRISGEKVLRK